MIKEIRSKLQALANPTLAGNYKRYLKSPYEFYGIRVPQLRKIAKELVKTKNLSIYDSYNLFEELWNSGNHEEMCLAIFILQNYKKQYNMETWRFLTQEKILNKLKTWDHVDALCSGILGLIVLENIQLNSQLKEFSQSRNPWIRRVSIVTQFPSIRNGKIQYAIQLAEKLCYDDDIYVQKATGWMLREVGKKNASQVQEFIKIHKNMKPSCLSYATEKMLPFRKLIKSIKQEAKDKIKNSKSVEDVSSNELDKIKYFKN